MFVSNKIKLLVATVFALAVVIGVHPVAAQVAPGHFRVLAISEPEKKEKAKSNKSEKSSKSSKKARADSKAKEATAEIHSQEKPAKFVEQENTETGDGEKDKKSQIPMSRTVGDDIRETSTETTPIRVKEVSGRQSIYRPNGANFDTNPTIAPASIPVPNQSDFERGSGNLVGGTAPVSYATADQPTISSALGHNAARPLSGSTFEGPTSAPIRQQNTPGFYIPRPVTTVDAASSSSALRPPTPGPTTGKTSSPIPVPVFGVPVDRAKTTLVDLSSSPSSEPSGSPTKIPTSRPTGKPTVKPTRRPTRTPTPPPTRTPTRRPTTPDPTNEPTFTPGPTTSPSSYPTPSPSSHPTASPSAEPTSSPSAPPSALAATVVHLTGGASLNTLTKAPTHSPTVADASSSPTASAEPSVSSAPSDSSFPTGAPSVSPYPTAKPTSRVASAANSSPDGYPTWSPTTWLPTVTNSPTIDYPFYISQGQDETDSRFFRPSGGTFFNQPEATNQPVGVTSSETGLARPVSSTLAGGSVNTPSLVAANSESQNSAGVITAAARPGAGATFEGPTSAPIPQQTSTVTIPVSSYQRPGSTTSSSNGELLKAPTGKPSLAQTVSSPVSYTSSSIPLVPLGRPGSGSSLVPNTVSPTAAASSSPTGMPTPIPSAPPTFLPTRRTTAAPTTAKPTGGPTMRPTVDPTHLPTITPMPTVTESDSPTGMPTGVPTVAPTEGPTRAGTLSPTALTGTLVRPSSSTTSLNRLTRNPSRSPTVQPDPTRFPTYFPTYYPSQNPSSRVTAAASSPQPTNTPTRRTTKRPTKRPTKKPTRQPAQAVNGSPDGFPTFSPTTFVPSVSNAPTIDYPFYLSPGTTNANDAESRFIDRPVASSLSDLEEPDSVVSGIVSSAGQGSPTGIDRGSVSLAGGNMAPFPTSANLNPDGNPTLSVSAVRPLAGATFDQPTQAPIQTSPTTVQIGTVNRPAVGSEGGTAEGQSIRPPTLRPISPKATTSAPVSYPIISFGLNRPESTLVVDSPSPTGTPSGMPSMIPTPRPTPQPTIKPTRRPTRQPTPPPTRTPTDRPTTPDPTNGPTYSPRPTVSPSSSPTARPTRSPTGMPSSTPTGMPSSSPTSLVQKVDRQYGQAAYFTAEPSVSPVATPSGEPSFSNMPSVSSMPSFEGSLWPSYLQAVKDGVFDESEDEADHASATTEGESSQKSGRSGLSNDE